MQVRTLSRAPLEVTRSGLLRPQAGSNPAITIGLRTWVQKLKTLTSQRSDISRKDYLSGLGQGSQLDLFGGVREIDETTALLTRQTLKTVSRVRIPLPPPFPIHEPMFRIGPRWNH